MSKYEGSYGYQTQPRLKTYAVKHMTCELCGTTHMHKIGTPAPTICHRCNHKYGEVVPIHTYASDKAKPTTHNQMRIYCQVCKHRAVVWLSKKNRKPNECPKCGETGYKVRSTKIRAEGECKIDTVWERQQFPRPTSLSTKPKKKRFHCDECGRPHFYLIRPPGKCANCGKDFLEHGKSSDSIPI